MKKKAVLGACYVEASNQAERIEGYNEHKPFILCAFQLAYPGISAPYK